MGKFKTILITSGTFMLAFAWKLFIAILVGILLFYVSRKLIDYFYQKTYSKKWD